MRKYLAIILIGIFIILPLALAQERPRVAVLSNSYSNWSGYDRELEAKLTDLLFSLDRFELVERRYIDNVLKEQALQLSYGSPDTIIRAGRLLGATYGFVIQLDNINTDWSKDSYKAEIKLSVKCVEIETGKIIGAKQANGYGFNRSTDLAISEAIEMIFLEDLTPAIKSWFRLGSSIVSRSDNFVYIALGQNAGVKKNSRYLVFKEVDLGIETQSPILEEVGLVEIKNSGYDWAQAVILKENEPIKAGFIVSEQVLENYKLFSFSGVIGKNPGLEVSYGFYRPWSHMANVSVIFEASPQILNTIVVTEYLKELRFTNNLSLFIGGGLGSSLGTQSDLSGSSINSLSYLANGRGILKLTLGDSYDFRVGAAYFLATTYNNWYYDYSKIPVPNYRVTAKEYNPSGLRLNIGISFSF